MRGRGIGAGIGEKRPHGRGYFKRGYAVPRWPYHPYSACQLMLNSLGNDKHLTDAEGNRAIPQLDVERSFEDKKKIVRLVMFVPTERPFKLGHHDVLLL
jgi:hypothetical protein